MSLIRIEILFMQSRDFKIEDKSIYGICAPWSLDKKSSVEQLVKLNFTTKESFLFSQG